MDLEDTTPEGEGVTLPTIPMTVPAEGEAVVIFLVVGVVVEEEVVVVMEKEEEREERHRLL